MSFVPICMVASLIITFGLITGWFKNPFEDDDGDDGTDIENSKDGTDIENSKDGTDIENSKD